MRKKVQAFDADHRPLLEDISVVRYEDILGVFHGGWTDPKTGKVKLLLSSLHGGKVRLVHDRHRRYVHLEYNI